MAGCVWRSLDLKLNNPYFMLFDIFVLQGFDLKCVYNLRDVSTSY